MSWSYGGDPSASDKDFVRFTLGDTIQTDPLLTDEEILGVLSAGVVPLDAVVSCCEALATKFARLCDSRLGPQSKAYAQKYEHYSKEAIKFRKRLLNSVSVPTAPGIVVEDLPTVAKESIFSHDMMTEVEVSSDLTQE